MVCCAGVLLYVLKSCLSVCFCPLYSGFIEVMQCRITESPLSRFQETHLFLVSRNFNGVPNSGSYVRKHHYSLQYTVCGTIQVFTFVSLFVCVRCVQPACLQTDVFLRK